MMQKNDRFCKILGHEKYSVYHVCTFPLCDIASRLCCPECFQNGIHQHEQKNYSHVMLIQNFIQKQYDNLEREYSYINEERERHFYKKILNKFLEIQIILIELMKNVEKEIENIIYNQDKLQQYICNPYENNFEYLDDEEINKLLKMQNQESTEYRKQFLLKPLEQIKQRLGKTESIIINHYSIQCEKKPNSIINLNDKKFIIKEIDSTNSRYFASSISNNQQYIAYGQNNKKDYLLRIYDIKIVKQIKEIKYNAQIMSCQFTMDSSQLYAAQWFCIWICCLRSILKYFSVISSLFRYLQSNKNKKQIFNNLWIGYIYYQNRYSNRSQNRFQNRYQNKLINILIKWPLRQATCQWLWNCRNEKIIINRIESHTNDIRQIQFIEKNKYILSLDLDGNIHKWEIDFIKKDLMIIKVFSESKKIFNFYQINQDNNLLLICSKQVKIINKQGEMVTEFEYSVEDSTYSSCSQLDNPKYIQIRALQNILLVTVQD